MILKIRHNYLGPSAEVVGELLELDVHPGSNIRKRFKATGSAYYTKPGANYIYLNLDLLNLDQIRSEYGKLVWGCVEDYLMYKHVGKFLTKLN